MPVDPGGQVGAKAELSAGKIPERGGREGSVAVPEELRERLPAERVIGEVDGPRGDGNETIEPGCAFIMPPIEWPIAQSGTPSTAASSARWAAG